MVGMNSESYRYNNVWAKRADVMNDNKPDINTSTGTQSNGGYRGEWSSLGYFGRLNYDFDGRYLFEFNIRRDGSSRFRADQRWATFPSVSVGWNIAREAFWEPLTDWVNTLKPRFPTAVSAIRIPILIILRMPSRTLRWVRRTKAVAG